jgi:Putative peptidoglycan binding domain
MKRIGIFFIALFLACQGVRAFILDEEIFSSPSTDSLAPRDGHGLLHQMPTVRATDFDRRYIRRWIYYFMANEQLMVQPAYVAALQRDLHRLGYYCGPIDGVFSDDVGDAIARLQKNYSMRVTGTLTDPVRRALHLP